MNVLPADRLRSTAERLLTAQPEPPRKIGIPDVLGAYQVLGLLLVPDFVILVVLFAVGGAGIRPWVVALGGFMIVFGLVVVALTANSARSALEAGTVAEGEVMAVRRRGWPGFGQEGLIRLDMRAEPFEARFAWGGLANVEQGARLRVLIGEKPGRVLLTLGPAS